MKRILASILISLIVFLSCNISPIFAVSLDNYLANQTVTGSQENINVKVLFSYLNVGQGEFKNVDPYSLNFMGKIDFSGYNSDLDLVVELTDKDAEALSGTCQITLNGLSGNGNYIVDKSSLIINANIAEVGNQQITMKKINSGYETEIKLSGAYDYLIHLTPMNQ